MPGRKEQGTSIGYWAFWLQIAGMFGMTLSFATAGIVLGSVIAFLVGGRLEPLLFAQKARDPVIFAGVAAVLLAVALAATLQPAWRAARVDPTRALRGD